MDELIQTLSDYITTERAIIGGITLAFAICFQLFWGWLFQVPKPQPPLGELAETIVAALKKPQHWVIDNKYCNSVSIRKEYTLTELFLFTIYLDHPSVYCDGINITSTLKLYELEAIREQGNKSKRIIEEKTRQEVIDSQARVATLACEKLSKLVKSPPAVNS